MKAVLLGTLVAVMVVAANSAYADDFAVSIQDAIDTMTDLRNDYLAESFFGESYLTPRTAAVETVNSAIALYESTRANPNIAIEQRSAFVQHPLNPYGTTVVAFDVINSMNADTEVYPFIIDVSTLKILAEGAFPATVGLSAFFLDEADRPLEDILEDLQESDGTWVAYDFTNHNTGSHDVKRVWLSLHDGYIFGAGYYEVRSDDALDRVGSMVRMYDADGADSFASISAGSDGVSFVLDAGTLGIVAHTNPDVSGSAISDAIGTTWHLGFLSEILAEHGSLSVSYPSTDPQSGSEYILAHLRLHDGYVFGSGHGMTKEQRIQSLANEAVQLYELEGEDAFGIITVMEGIRLIVMDLDGNTLAAFAGWPNLVGQSLGIDFFEDQEAEIKFLEDNPGLWTDNIFVNPFTPTTQELRSSNWVVLHDGYIFVAADVYSPEEAVVDMVDEAIELYKTHGEGAFDRITWQSAVPRIIYPFVADAQSWELVAHGALPERVGVCCAAPIAASNDLDAARQALEQNPGIWLEYTFYNPVSERDEYKRVWLSTYDGYTFAAGYYYGNFDSMERVIQEVIDIYEAEGRDAAFASVNAMRAAGLDYPFILDRETLEIVAHGQNPDLVGTNFEDKALGGFHPASKIEADLHNNGDTTYAHYNILNLATGAIPPKIVLFQLHDEYIFAAGQAFAIYTR